MLTAVQLHQTRILQYKAHKQYILNKQARAITKWTPTPHTFLDTFIYQTIPYLNPLGLNEIMGETTH